MPEWVETQIRADLNRTVIGNTEFMLDPTSGKNRLYNILKAYAHLDPEVGYMQGMSFIAAMILLNVRYEEDAFWCLVYILLPKKGLKTCLSLIKGKHNWRKMFIDGMPKVF